MPLMHRPTDAELMDAPAADPSDLAVALRDLRRVNRWLGGWRVLRGRMAELLGALPRGRYRVLDIGTGSADLPLRLARWARQRGYRLEVVATDLHARTLAIARHRIAGEPDVRLALADARDLPFDDGGFDFALCCTTLHHFEPAEAAQVLREMRRVSRLGLVVSDLRRSRSALLGARVLAGTAWRRSRFTRHDGPLSVRKAFTAGELRVLSSEAGLSGARVRRHAPFRLSLLVDCLGQV